MNAAKRRYEDYDYDEQIVDDDDEQMDEHGYSFVDMVKNKFRSLFDPEYYDDSEDSEAEEDEVEEQPRAARSAASSLRRASKRQRVSYEEEEPSSQRKTSTYGIDDISSEDIKRYSEKFGTRPAPMREERRQKVRERMDPGVSERRSTQPRRTTSAPAWENYRGNVKRVVRLSPRTIDNIEEIASLLMDDYAVIIDLANMKNARDNVISYLSGVSYAINYHFDEIGDEYYICAPEGYMVSHDFGTYISKKKSNG